MSLEIGSRSYVNGLIITARFVELLEEISHLRWDPRCRQRKH